MEKYKKYYYYILFTTILYSCMNPQSSNKKERIYFTFDEQPRMIVPITFNDSIVANMFFDTAGDFIIDSTFLSSHPTITGNAIVRKKNRTGSAWSKDQTYSRYYHIHPKIQIGQHELKNSNYSVADWKGYMVAPNIDGMFRIPPTDSINVWFFNFEDHYMEIFPSDHFETPKGFMTFHLEMTKENNYKPTVTLPLKIKTDDGDTITLKRPYSIDTGTHRDIILTNHAKELPFFSSKESTWIGWLNSYIKYCNTTASLYGITLDSLRIYTIDQKNNVNSSYFIGLNFLKRFNVYFDLKRKIMGLQPISKFQRIIDKHAKRYHIGFEQAGMANGRFIINTIATSKDNEFWTSGLQLGDEVLAANGIPWKQITLKQKNNLFQKEKIIFDIIRNKRKMQIVVNINKNNIVGD